MKTNLFGFIAACTAILFASLYLYERERANGIEQRLKAVSNVAAKPIQTEIAQVRKTISNLEKQKTRALAALSTYERVDGVADLFVCSGCPIQFKHRMAALTKCKEQLQVRKTTLLVLETELTKTQQVGSQ